MLPVLGFRDQPACFSMYDLMRLFLCHSAYSLLGKEQERRFSLEILRVAATG